MTTHTPQSLGTSELSGGLTPDPSEGNASVRERAGQVGGTAKDEAAGVAQEVKYQARDLVSEARGQVRQQVDTQKGRVSDLLREVSEELEQMAERSDRNGIASELARQAAGRARDVRGYLDGGGDVVEDVRRFARRRPGTFLLGALAAGVLAGRATRAAAAARSRQTDAPSGRPFGAGTPGHAGEAGGYGTTGYAGTSGYAAATADAAYPQSAGYSGTAGYGTAGPDAGYPATPDTPAGGVAYGTSGMTGTPGVTEAGTAYGTTGTTGTTEAGTAGYRTTAAGAPYLDPDAGHDPAGGYRTGPSADGTPSAYDAPGTKTGTDPLRDHPEGTLPPEREDRS